MSTSEHDDRLARITAAVQRLRREYADDPNVITVGWGLPARGGRTADELAIIVHVREKLGSERAIAAAGSSPIPPEVDGFPTDVRALRLEPSAAGQRDDNQYDPLRGGVASSNAANHVAWFNSFGTLGILARDTATNAPVALSNWHVWGDGGAAGDDIIQPGHPTAGDHIEAIGKVAACGPLLTSLIEWEVPSPLTVGLYGGAATAAVAAALSDVRDPTRRGQDATVPPAGATTMAERVEVAIEYPQLPLPGRPFATDVRWDYIRRTDQGDLTSTVAEQRRNAQFLLGKHVVADRNEYRPGEVVRLIAGIWDHQRRACTDFHVVAHLFPTDAPGRVRRAVMTPVACPRPFPESPPDELRCVTFDDVPVGPYPANGRFDWLDYRALGAPEIRVVNWLPADQGVVVPSGTLRLAHPPADRVVLTVATFTDVPVTAVVIDAAGQAVDSVTSPPEQGVPHRLELNGSGIVGAIVRGGGGEGVLLRYCLAATADDIEITVPETVAGQLRAELGNDAIVGGRLRSTRCCFATQVPLPPDVPSGRWEVHVSVQNVNTVAPGTPAEQAATVIGGHLLSAHTSAEVTGCVAIMLADHVFDII